MASGIAKNDDKNKKVKKSPAGKNDKSSVCVSSFGQTRDKGLTGFKGLSVGSNLKDQIRNGEYKAIKLSDKPLEVKRDESRDI